MISPVQPTENNVNEQELETVTDLHEQLHAV